MTRHDLRVTGATRRLDKAISLDLSRRRIKQLIEAGHVFVNGKRSRVGSRNVVEGARIVLHDVDPIQQQPIDVLFEDERIVVVNKSPGDHLNETETSPINSLSERLDAFVVHRLDRETSGVVVLAKTKNVASALSAAFAERRVQKKYVALAEGEVVEGTIDRPIATDPRRPRARRVHPSGKASKTVVTPISTVDGVTLLQAEPLTGRTHQIRVHLAHTGSPLLGDVLYGGPKSVRFGQEVRAINRVMLHSRSLVLPLMNEETRFEAPLPTDLADLADLADLM